MTLNIVSSFQYLPPANVPTVSFTCKTPGHILGQLNMGAYQHYFSWLSISQVSECWLTSSVLLVKWPHHNILILSLCTTTCRNCIIPSTPCPSCSSLKHGYTLKYGTVHRVLVLLDKQPMNTTTTHCYRPVLVSEKVIYMQMENQKAIP
jgi:hypothetical protein